MSGLIYGAIVVMWVAFLVPMWLKRHDDAVEAKSVDKFSTTMKVLARRTTAPDIGSYDPEAMVAGSASAGPIEAAPRRFLRGARGRLAWPSSPTRVPISAAARRQRVLAALAAVTVVVAVLALLSLVPWIAVVAVALFPIAYVGSIAHLARRDRRLSWAARAVRSTYDTVRRSPTALVDADASHTVKINPALVRRDAVRPQLAAAAAASTASDAAHDRRGGGPAPDGFDGPRVGWEPVPVPVPMYVSAPRAPRAVRSIDLATDSAWTSGRLVADAKAAAAAAVSPSSRRDSDAEPARRAVGD